MRSLVLRNFVKQLVQLIQNFKKVIFSRHSVFVDFVNQTHILHNYLREN